jgi:cell division protein FtsI (penicillin-binding protein 3)
MREAPTLYQRRIVIGAGLCVIAFALVGLRLVHVSLLKSWDGGRARAPIVARADLTDRNGELLARDIPVKDLYARPQYFNDKAEAADSLAEATGADATRLLKAFENARHPYVLIARRVTPDTEARVMHLGLPGLEFEPSAMRYYPDGRTAAQVVGVTDPDGNGISGLELGLQPEIRAAAKAHGRGQVATSIDMRVQFILQHEVAQARKKFSARAAGGIVMDVNSGEVLAMVSLPDFDPNQRGLDHGDSRRNIMAQDVYELGSVFKIFSFTMALDDHTLKSLDEVFPIGQGFRIGKHIIHEAEHMPATLTARDILAQSSNIGTSQIVLRSGGAREHEFLAHMGLLDPVKTELPETARPLYPTVWGDIQTANVGFGQGIAVSPLSFVTAAASVVNGGRRITPTFLKQNGRDRRGQQLIDPQTSLKMRDLLRYVVTDGSGKKADVDGYDVGGKTGSAQVAGPNGRYIPRALRTSFCAVFPVHDPRYVVFVFLDQPHGTKETGGFALAGWTAAPIAGKVIQRIAPLLGVPYKPVPTRLARESPL